jgi:hypothetical protein
MMIRNGSNALFFNKLDHLLLQPQFFRTLGTAEQVNLKGFGVLRAKPGLQKIVNALAAIHDFTLPDLFSLLE